MDMKRILQALDNSSTQPVEGASDMSKFLSIVDKNASIQVLQEASPHKVALPVQMAMQHYQQPVAKKQPRERLIDKYFTEAEELINQRKEEKRALINQYAQTIAERVLMKESRRSIIAENSNNIGTMPTTEYVKGIYAAAAENGMGAPEVDAVKKQMVLAPNGEVDLLATMQKAIQAFQSPEWKKMIADLDALVKKAEAPMEGWFDSKPKVDWNKRAKELFAKGMTEQQVAQQLIKEGCPPSQVNVYVQAGQMEEAGEAGWGRVGMAGVGLQPIAEMPIDMTGDPNDPTIYGHEKANPMSLKGRIMSARSQLKELAQMAESNDLATWQQICKLSKGGMFMGLEQNLEQIRHGISELATKRKKGGVSSRGIDKNIDENGIKDTLVSAGATARKAVDKAVSSIPRPFDEKEVANDLKSQTSGQATKPKTESLRTENPCWKGYKPVGTKKKAGKTVPNCVPKK